MKKMMISIGEFFFRYRNQAFPLIILALFMLAVPPSKLAGSEVLKQTKDLIALLIALSGLLLRATVIGYAYIKRGGLNKKVFANNLVEEGMFGVCRNPLYVGNMLIYSGVFLMHGDPLIVVAGIALYALLYQCIVLAEEVYLNEKFGDDYRAYCVNVRRWIPSFSKFTEATRGMEFNFTRVIIKDYSTIAAALITLSLVKVYEYIVLPNPLQYLEYFVLLSVFIVAVGAFAGTVSYCKHRGILREKRAV
ncbi:methyltransferase family protein [Rhizobium binxianense]